MTDSMPLRPYLPKRRAPAVSVKTVTDEAASAPAIDTAPQPFTLSPNVIGLFSAFVFMTAYAFVNIPGLGVSWSLVPMALILLELLTGRSSDAIQLPKFWSRWSFVFFIAILVSLLVNLVGRAVIQGSTVILLLQWAYWLILFLLTAVFIQVPLVQKRVPQVLFFAALALIATRGLEATVLGNFGYGLGTEFTSQNFYGLMFSMWTIYIVHVYLNSTLQSKPLLLVLVGIAGVVILINGSRGSWAGVILSLFAYFAVSSLGGALLARGDLRQLSGRIVSIVSIALIVVIGYQLLPPNVQALFDARADTVDNLRADKSVLIREWLIQKGLQHMRENPVFGIGISGWRFTFNDAPPPLPPGLRYETIDHFNRKSSHNSYILLLAEHGLVGTVVYSVLFVTLLVSGGVAAIKLGGYGHTWPFVVYGSFVGMSFHLWGLTSMGTTSTWMVYGLVLGMILYARRLPPIFVRQKVVLPPIVRMQRTAPPVDVR